MPPRDQEQPDAVTYLRFELLEDTPENDTPKHLYVTYGPMRHKLVKNDRPDVYYLPAGEVVLEPDLLAYVAESQTNRELFLTNYTEEDLVRIGVAQTKLEQVDTPCVVEPTPDLWGA